MSAHALYRFFGPAGELLYVGITADPGARWKKHSKDKPWWHEVANVTVERYPTRQAVLEAERAAITSEAPRYNVIYNRGTSASHSAPLLDRVLPIQPGDWAALGLRDGRCPVGGIVAVDDEWISIRLKNFMYGHLTNHVIAVRWGDVERVELAYPEDAKESDSILTPGAVEFDDRHLGEFQTAWHRVHFGDGRDPVEQARRDVAAEHARDRS